jgi:hypothetical protein
MASGDSNSSPTSRYGRHASQPKEWDAVDVPDDLEADVQEWDAVDELADLKLPGLPKAAPAPAPSAPQPSFMDRVKARLKRKI